MIELSITQIAFYSTVILLIGFVIADIFMLRKVKEIEKQYINQSKPDRDTDELLAEYRQKLQELYDDNYVVLKQVDLDEIPDVIEYFSWFKENNIVPTGQHKHIMPDSDNTMTPTEFGNIISKLDRSEMGLFIQLESKEDVMAYRLRWC